MIYYIIFFFWIFSFFPGFLFVLIIMLLSQQYERFFFFYSWVIPVSRITTVRIMNFFGLFCIFWYCFAKEFYSVSSYIGTHQLNCNSDSIRVFANSVDGKWYIKVALIVIPFITRGDKISSIYFHFTPDMNHILILCLYIYLILSSPYISMLPLFLKWYKEFMWSIKCWCFRCSEVS